MHYYKSNNEIMQYCIVSNDIALIMHYRALLKRSDLNGHFHWFLGQKASKIGTQPPYIPNLNFVSMSIPATIPIKFLESVCHKLYSEIEITRTPGFVEIPRSPRYISNKRLENRLYTSSTTTRKKLLPNIGKVVEN